MNVTVRELAEFLATQPPDAEIRLAGVADHVLIGWTSAERTTAPNGEPIVLLAFEGPNDDWDWPTPPRGPVRISDDMMEFDRALYWQATRELRDAS